MNRKRQINQHNRAETPSNRDAAPIENRTVSPPNKYREEKNISKRRTSKRRILLQINWSEFRGTTSLLQRKQNIFNQLSLRGDFRNPVTKKSENGQSSFNKFTNFTGVQYSHFMLFWPVPHMSDRTHTPSLNALVESKFTRASSSQYSLIRYKLRLASLFRCWIEQIPNIPDIGRHF